MEISEGHTLFSLARCLIAAGKRNCLLIYVCGSIVLAIVEEAMTSQRPVLRETNKIHLNLYFLLPLSSSLIINT